MDEPSSPPADVSGCLVKVTLFVVCLIVSTIFFIGLIAGIVIASGL